MPWARILAVIDGTPGSEAALAAALNLGRRHAARVELLHVEVEASDAIPVVGEGLSGAAVEQIMQTLQAEAEKRRKRARALYEDKCEAAKLPLSEPDAPLEAGRFSVAFRHLVGREAEEVLRRGRLSDLIVMARPAREDEAVLSATFDVALFETGRPVLLVPAGPVERLGETVALAWNGSREAVRAIGAALPVLSKAKKVVILSGREPGDETEPSALAAYLAGYGIAARTWAFTPGAQSIGEALLKEAEKAEADLMVMGAYGRSRLRELVLGGATRGVLSHGTIPVFLVH